MSALICGSIAYDTIMVFHDHFKNHILPDKIHILNVSFLVPELRKEYGGCAGNIGYNLKLLGGDGLIMGTVGEDFNDYSDWLDKHDISQQHIKRIENAHTPQAFITTDFDANQITAFHVGAMDYSHELKVSDATDVSVGIIAPDTPRSMTEHAQQFVDADIPFIFDASQNILLFDGDALNNETRLVSHSDRALQWLVGAFYSDTQNSQVTATNIPLFVPDSVQDLKSESISIFAEISREFANGTVEEAQASPPAARYLCGPEDKNVFQCTADHSASAFCFDFLTIQTEDIEKALGQDIF